MKIAHLTQGRWHKRLLQIQCKVQKTLKNRPFPAENIQNRSILAHNVLKWIYFGVTVGLRRGPLPYRDKVSANRDMGCRSEKPGFLEKSKKGSKFIIFSKKNSKKS